MITEPVDKQGHPVPASLQPANLNEAQALIARLQANLKAGFELQVQIASDSSILRTRLNDMESQVVETTKVADYNWEQMNKLGIRNTMLALAIQAALRCKSASAMRKVLRKGLSHE